VLLWTVQRNRIRTLPEVGEFCLKVQEFHLTASQPDAAHLQSGQQAYNFYKRRSNPFQVPQRSSSLNVTRSASSL